MIDAYWGCFDGELLKTGLNLLCIMYFVPNSQRDLIYNKHDNVMFGLSEDWCIAITQNSTPAQCAGPISLMMTEF